MATTNFLEWNPQQNNQEPDAVFSTDGQRLNGFAVDDLVPSPLFNKVLRQYGTFVAAFGQMLANKGFNNSDASVSALVAVLMNLLTTADQSGLIQIVPFSSTPTFDARVAPNIEIGLQGDVTSSTLLNIVAGMKLVFIIGQGPAGGHNFAWPTNFQFVNPGVPDTDPNRISVQEFIVTAGMRVIALGPMISYQ